MTDSDPNPEFESESGSNDNRSQVDQIVEETLERMQRGEDVDFEEVNREHSELQPELSQRLLALQRIFALVEDSSSAAAGQSRT
ncbi:MAG: hypothetical protein ACR2NP_03710, partial [Pirellulaceae bacterium]